MDDGSGFLAGGGITGAALRARDWAAGPLGAPAGWPAALRTLVAVMLGSGQPMFVAWGPGRILIHNDAYAPILGARAAHALGRPFFDVWPEIAAEVGALMDRVFAGEPVHMDDLALTLERNGHPEEAHFAFSYIPVVDEAAGPGVAGLFCACSEITEMVVAQRRLTAERDRQRRMLQQAPGFVALLHGRDHVFDWVNDAYVALVGRRDLPGRPAREAFPEVEGQGFFELLDGVFASGEAVSAHAMPIRFAGENGRYVDFIYQPIRDDAGEVAGIFVGGYDVTGHVTVETALRESEARFRAVSEAMPGFVFTADAAGAIGYASQNWRAYSGADADAGDGRGWSDFVHPDDAERARLAWDASIGTGAFYEVEYRLRRADGQYLWWLARATPSRDPVSGETRWVGVCTELQDIVAARETLARSRAELERQVEARTRTLLETEEALRQAQKMEAVGQLTGGIAHDFNNMLAVVVGSLDLLRRRLDPGDARALRHVDAAADASARAAQLTQRLLSFARRQPLNPETLDLAALVAGMADLIGHSIGPDVRFETRLPPGLWSTLVDRNQLENVILNLAINARDAMPGGGVLTLALDNAADVAKAAGDYVRLEVADTGTGMTPEVRARAFDPFFTTKEVGRGTGLGLSQVYGFVQQSGGWAEIDSTVGQGTTVRLYLPRDVSAEPTPETVDPQVGSPGAAPRACVLVVEDEAAVRQFSVDALGELGYGVLEADGAAAALALLEANPGVDLLFTDVVMPQIDGRALAVAARRMRPDLKVLFTTGYARDALTHDGVLEPGVEVLAKPFSLDDLAAKVRRVLEG